MSGERFDGLNQLIILGAERVKLRRSCGRFTAQLFAFGSQVAGTLGQRAAQPSRHRDGQNSGDERSRQDSTNTHRQNRNLNAIQIGLRVTFRRLCVESYAPSNKNNPRTVYRIITASIGYCDFTAIGWR